MIFNGKSLFRFQQALPLANKPLISLFFLHQIYLAMRFFLNVITFLCFGMLMMLFSCTRCIEGEEATSEYTIEFNAAYDGAPIDVLNDYPFDNYTIKFSRFNIFLSDVTLVAADGSEHLLSEIEFVDFAPPTDPTTVMDPIKRTYTVSNGNYTAIKLGYGVKPSLNAKKPADFPAGNPLADNVGEYWDSWRSYIFMKIEGNGNTDADPIAEINFGYHCGSDAVYRTMTRPISLNLTGPDAQSKITFDLKKLFYADNTWYDIQGSPVTSNDVGDVKVAKFIMDALDQAVSFE